MLKLPTLDNAVRELMSQTAMTTGASALPPYSLVTCIAFAIGSRKTLRERRMKVSGEEEFFCIMMREIFG